VRGDSQKWEGERHLGAARERFLKLREVRPLHSEQGPPAAAETKFEELQQGLGCDCRAPHAQTTCRLDLVSCFLLLIHPSALHTSPLHSEDLLQVCTGNAGERLCPESVTADKVPCAKEVRVVKRKLYRHFEPSQRTH
jgi:hypothetical protein